MSEKKPIVEETGTIGLGLIFMAKNSKEEIGSFDIEMKADDISRGELLLLTSYFIKHVSKLTGFTPKKIIDYLDSTKDNFE